MKASTKKRWSNFWEIFWGVAIFLLVTGLVVVFPAWAISNSAKGNKMCAAKYGTTDVSWSFPDECYIKGTK